VCCCRRETRNRSSISNSSITNSHTNSKNPNPGAEHVFAYPPRLHQHKVSVACAQEEFAIIKHKMTLDEALSHEFVARLDVEFCRTGASDRF
jgi:hypothetical protein